MKDSQAYNAEVLSEETLLLPSKLPETVSQNSHACVLTIYSSLSNSQVPQEASYSDTGRWPAYSRQAMKLHFCASQKLQDVFSLKITQKIPPQQLARHISGQLYLHKII